MLVFLFIVKIFGKLWLVWNWFSRAYRFFPVIFPLLVMIREHTLYNFNSLWFVMVFDPGYALSWWSTCNLERVYILLLGRVIEKCQVLQLKLLFSCSILVDFLLVLLITERRMLRSTTIIRGLSISPFGFVFAICILKICCLLYIFRIACVLSKLTLLSFHAFFIPSNFHNFEVYFDINIVIPAFVWLLFAWVYIYILDPSFYFNVPISLYLKWVARREQIVGTCLKNLFWLSFNLGI